LDYSPFPNVLVKACHYGYQKGLRCASVWRHFFVKAQRKAGYDQVSHHTSGSKELYVCSGHYAKYGADSFQPIRTPDVNEEFLLKPMNCPHHCEIFKAMPRSYKDLPVRFAEFGTVYRYEQSGELHGLTRVRGFTQDDAHIFCTQDQVKDEFKKVIDLVLYTFSKHLISRISKLKFPCVILKTGTNTSVQEENWEKAEQRLLKPQQKKLDQQ
jgi:threonyl-tRNA synthetase